MSISPISLVFFVLLMATRAIALPDPPTPSDPTVEYPRSSTFIWTFPTLVSPEHILEACGHLEVQILRNIPNDGLFPFAPPYYMLAFEEGGSVQRTFLGSEDSNLTWSVTHQPGTDLWLEVVDAFGSTGGLDRYTVVANGLPSCSPPTSDTALTVSSQTTDLSKCDPWSLSINGGLPPYSVTILSADSPHTVTNISLADPDDKLNLTNKGFAAGPLLAAVSDSAGTWAKKTLVVSASGSLNESCGTSAAATSSSSRNASLASIDKGTANTTTPSDNGEKAKQSSQWPNAAVVAGVVAGGIGTFLAFLVIFVLWWYRRRHPKRQNTGIVVEIIPESIPQPYPQSATNEPMMRKYPSSEHTKRLFKGTPSSTFSTSSSSSAEDRASHVRVYQHKDSAEVVTEIPPPYRGNVNAVVNAQEGEHLQVHKGSQV